MRITQGGRARRFFGVAVAATTVASVMGLAPAAHALPGTFVAACTNHVGDVASLNAAVTSAVGNPGSTVQLGSKCVYTYDDTTPLGDPSEHTALPEITVPMTIEGNNATIQRSKAAHGMFRLIEVDIDTTLVTTGMLIVSDLTVKGGKLDFLNDPANFDNSGGGIVVNRGASLAGTNLTVRDNTVRIVNTGTGPSGPSGGFGFALALAGGIGVDAGSSLFLTHSDVKNNSATSVGVRSYEVAAGGIGNAGITEITDTDVSGNRVNGYGPFCSYDAGGGIATTGPDHLLVTGSDIRHNTAAGYTSDGSSCEGPPSSSLGGGIASVVFALDLDGNGETHIVDTDFSGNTAKMTGGTAAAGGAIFNGSRCVVDVNTGGCDPVAAATFTVTGSDVKGNQADCHDTWDCTALGGGYAQGRVFVSLPPVATIAGTDFTKNKASSNEGPAVGGGLAIFDGNLDLSGGTVKSNTAKGGPGTSAGGGIWVNDTFATVNLDGTTVISKNKPDNCFPFTTTAFTGTGPCA